MKITDIKSGDLVLEYNPNTLGDVMRLVDMPIAHVGIVYDIARDTGDVPFTKSGEVDQRYGKLKMRVMEANYTGMEMNLYDVDNPNIIIMRYNGEYDEDGLRQAMWKYYSELHQAGKAGYSYKGFIDAGINGLLKYVSFGFWKKKRLLGNDIKAFCSEFVIECIERHIGYKLYKGSYKNVMAPSDFLTDNKFTLLKDMKIENYQYKTLFDYFKSILEKKGFKIKF